MHGKAFADKRHMHRVFFVIEVILLILTLTIFINHLFYRNNYEKRGWLVFDGRGSAYLVRDHGEASEYIKHGFAAIWYEPHITNMLAVYSDEMIPIFRMVMSEYEEMNHQAKLDIMDYQDEFYSKDRGIIQVKTDALGQDDMMTISFKWVTSVRGNRYLAITTSSDIDKWRLSLDSILSYLLYVIIMALIIRSLFLQSKIILLRYEHISVNGVWLDDDIDSNNL